MEDNQDYIEAVKLMNQGLYESALDAFRLAVKNEPERARIHSNMAATLFRLKRPEEALKKAELGCKLAPEDSYTLFRRAEILRKLDRNSEALADSERARELAKQAGDPVNFALASEQVCWALVELDRCREAYTTARDLLRDDPENADFHALMASILASLDRWGEALQAMQRAVAIEPEDQDLKRRLNLCAEGVDRLEPEVSKLEASVNQDSSWEDWHELGSAFFLVGRLEEAAQAYDEAHLRHPRGNRQKESAMLSVREADLRLRLIEQAVEQQNPS